MLTFGCLERSGDVGDKLDMLDILLGTGDP